MNRYKKQSARLTREMKHEIAGFRTYIYRTSDSVEVTGLHHLLDGDDNKVSVITSTHRSHLDYLILGAEMVTAGLFGIRFAAGDNLTRLPILGARFRRMGAFSVYRGKASQRNYLFKLMEQVKKLIEKGDLLIVFPEGGRSYDGHMMDLKGGIAGAAVIVQQENPDNEVCFQPVAISYDIPCEVPFLKYVLLGKKKRDEGKNRFEKLVGELMYYAGDIVPFVLRGIKARFGMRFGKIYVDYGAPVALNSLSDIQGLYREKAPNSFLSNSASIKECTEKLKPIFVNLYRILPHNIVAYVIKQNEKLTPETQSKKVDAILSELKEQGATFSTEKTGMDLYREGLEFLRRNGVGKVRKDQLEIKRRDILEYFAATIEDRIGVI